MSNFTKGPWLIEMNRRGQGISNIGPIRCEEYAGLAWIEANEHDVNLAAAAPKLYAACSTALSFLDAALDEEPSYDQIKDVLEELSAALVEARGEQ